jgi:hypothetical protein
MSDRHPYRTFEEFADAFELLRKQVRSMKWLIGFLAVAIILGFGVLFYFVHDFSTNAFVLGKAQSLERQTQSSIERSGAALRLELGGIREKIEKVEEDVTKLRSTHGDTGGGTAGAQDEVDPDHREKSANNSASTDLRNAPQLDIKNDDTRQVPLPRPRKVPQASVVLRSGATPSAGAAEVKVGNHIGPGQFVLQPIPEELANEMPRLKDKAFIRYGGQVYIVDPKDNQIIELLR